MNIYLNRLFLFVMLICMHSIGFSQKNTDGIFLFKTWFYIEHINNDSRYATDFSTKDSSVFSLFINNINLTLDTISSNNFSNEYIFLAVNPKRRQEVSITDSSIMYDKKNKFLKYTVIPAFCNRYVLCINKTSGMSYRIQGFTGNDFFVLLKDVRDEYYSKNKSVLKIKDFLKTYSVSDIDFRCIYKGLQSGSPDYQKYPCLYSCRGSNEIIWVH